MKIKSDFITNSSSSSFIIVNKTNTPLKLIEFVKENAYLIEHFRQEYSWDNKFTDEDVFKSCSAYDDIILNPGRNHCIFGDEQGPLLGRVYDYILREGGTSNRFTWEFDEFLR